MAAGPLRAPCWCEVVRSRGTGKITAREDSYREYSSGIPQKFSGGIGVYRLMVGLCVLGKFLARRSPAVPALLKLPAGAMNGKRIRPERRECYTARQLEVFTGSRAAGGRVSWYEGPSRPRREGSPPRELWSTSRVCRPRLTG